VDVATSPGRFADPRAAAGGREESVAQADWTPDGRLVYSSDRTGWWNLYRDGAPVCPREEEFGGPLWRPGWRWFAPLDNGLVAVLHGRGATALGVLDPETGEVVDAVAPRPCRTATRPVSSGANQDRKSTRLNSSHVK